ncbi:hypothetical protein BAE44_0023105, partial [Dichanthelium oligosanthes]
LVQGLANGDDPASALFTHVPMWKLAHDLGDCIGSTVKIDSNARVSIDYKFTSTRVHRPLYKVLQKEMMLADEITGEEVVIQIRYEKLPKFCLFCGFIGHMEARCDVSKTGRRISFSQDLRGPPVHFEDPCCRFLPGAMGQAPSSQLWCAPIPENQEQNKDSS